MTPDDDSGAAALGPAQYGPHRYAGEDGGDARLRGARFEVADLRGALFTDCDLSGVTIRDSWLADVSISGYLSQVTVNDVDVTGYVSEMLDRRYPERVQLRRSQTAADLRRIWAAVEQMWAQTLERAAQLPPAALEEQVREEWSFSQTLRHLVFITDAWASRTVLDQEHPYHSLGLPQSWFPAADAAALGIDLAARPGYHEILVARASRMEVMRRIITGLTDNDMVGVCERSPAPGYPEEERTVFECIAVVLEEEIEHHRYAVRDLAVLEAAC